MMWSTCSLFIQALRPVGCTWTPQRECDNDLCANKYVSRLRYPNWFVKAPGHILTLKNIQ